MFIDYECHICRGENGDSVVKDVGLQTGGVGDDGCERYAEDQSSLNALMDF